MSANNKNDNTKIFTFRSIPANLHRRWKAVASYMDVSMEDFGLAAIEAIVEANLRSIAEKEKGTEIETKEGSGELKDAKDTK